MRQFSASPIALARSLRANAALVRALVIREVIGRYQGSILGVLWSLFNPIFMLVIYTFFFSVIFKSRWTPGAAAEDRSQFALALFIGLIPFNLFTECINRAPGLILANANYVKKVVFPLEMLPIVSIGAACFHALVSLFVWLVFYFIAYGTPHVTALWLPLIVVPLLLLVAGASWMLSALGVYLRDVGQVTALCTTALMFISPVFFPASALPERFRPLFALNPLTPVIEMLRDAMMWGHAPQMHRILISLASGVAVAWLGFAWFQKTRRGFADVL